MEKLAFELTKTIKDMEKIFQFKIKDDQLFVQIEIFLKCPLLLLAGNSNLSTLIFWLIDPKERVPKKKLRKYGHMSKLWVGRVHPSQTFSEKKVWTKKFEVGRSDMDVHTSKSMQSFKYGDGRDLFPMALKGFLYILSPP